MKKRIVLLICFAIIILSFASCDYSDEYDPKGEFYIKTSPANGDAGVSYVISLEADHKTYEGDGDITVPMTVGFGHLPGASGYGDDVKDTFYLEYKIIEAPWQADKEPAWEKKVKYSDSWYDTKYNSTEQKNPPSLIFARYGEFYPLYKETVEFVFPSDVEKGTFEVSIVTVIDGEIAGEFGHLSFYFERNDGVLTLDPHNK